MAKTLLERRKELGLTREDIASRLGVSVGTVRNWEMGVIEPSARVTDLNKFGQAYECSLDEFIQMVASGHRLFQW